MSARIFLVGRPLLAAVVVSILAGAAPAGAAGHKAPMTLHIDVQGLDAVDPAWAYRFNSWQIEQATCARLVTYPDGPWTVNQQPVPEIAAHLPTISADRTTYTFLLQGNFGFSPPSNERVTAQSFKLAVERALRPGSGSPVFTFARDIVGAVAFHAGQVSSISGIVAAKKTELTIRLERPAGDFLARLAMPFFCPVPHDAPPVGEDAVVPSAGPYYVESFDRGGTTVVRKNPNYGGKRPRFFDVIVYRAADRATSEAEVAAGSADYAADLLPDQDYGSIAAAYGPGSPAAQAGHQQFFVNQVLGTRYLVLNVARPLFSSVELRKAVNYALDRPALASGEGAYGLTPTDQILPPGIPGFHDYDLYPLDGPDLATAQALAAESGRVPATAVLYVQDIAAGHDWAQTIKADLAPLGIDVQPQFFPRDQYFQRLSTPGEPFDLAVARWLTDYPDPVDLIGVFFHGKNVPGAGGNDLNYGSFDDPTFNQRIDDALPLQPPARYDVYASFDHDLMADAAPWGPWGNINSRDFFSARIGGQVFNPLFGMDLAALRLR
jgi:peptide/nickel transport system substrate-binding protein